MALKDQQDFFNLDLSKRLQKYDYNQMYWVNIHFTHKISMLLIAYMLMIAFFWEEMLTNINNISQEYEIKDLIPLGNILGYVNQNFFSLSLDFTVQQLAVKYGINTTTMVYTPTYKYTKFKTS
jgi:hypothetical protein